RRPLNNNARRPRRVHLIIPPLVALAKKNEELYIPDKKNPLILSADSPALYLFQRMRDEAHRFAIGFYRQTHRKKAVKSKLDEIPGIGPKTKKKLIQHFGSVRKIQQVSETELSDLVGNKTAKIIMDMLG
ncbi:hypothetical protein KKG41_03525, partial [Patescibacteria group bacterium]|nr:hypothetical protein [Patescibacteria group bacterium]MBU1890201.1 hypothetical protein [Patescibacteria group bacterium]